MPPPAPTEGPQRLFIALWPPPPVREAIAAWQSAWAWPRQAAKVKAERLHLTLHFLGDVAVAQAQDLSTRLARVEPAAFALEFDRGEVWDNGVAVLRPAATPAALRDLHARIGRAVEACGLALERRPYKPHVTLARRAFGATPPAVTGVLRWESAGAFALVRTMPGQGRYETLATFGA